MGSTSCDGSREEVGRSISGATFESLAAHLGSSSSTLKFGFDDI
jgi:hypothetical protein